MSITDFMSGNDAQPWWYYTKKRKKLCQRKTTHEIRILFFYVDSVEATMRFFENAFHQNRRFLHESGMYGELDTGSTILAFASHEMGDANLNGDYERTTSEDKPFGMELAFVVDNVLQPIHTRLHVAQSARPNQKLSLGGKTVGYVRTPDGI